MSVGIGRRTDNGSPSPKPPGKRAEGALSQHATLSAERKKRQHDSL